VDEREYKRSERPRVQGRYKQEESGLNKLLEGLVVASFLLVESGRDRWLALIFLILVHKESSFSGKETMAIYSLSICPAQITKHNDKQQSRYEREAIPGEGSSVLCPLRASAILHHCPISQRKAAQLKPPILSFLQYILPGLIF
jgi:hypothetical protein